MINTLEKIYFNIDDDNMKLHYLQNLLIQPEIKLKLCERILINENTHPNTIDVNRYSIRTYSSYQLIFNYFLQYYVSLFLIKKKITIKISSYSKKLFLTKYLIFDFEAQSNKL